MASQADEVTEVNRKLYDAVAHSYSNVDSRRSKKHPWLEQVFREILALQATPGGHLLDAGAGDGFITYFAQDYFSEITAIDISQKMLDLIQLRKDKENTVRLRKVCGDLNHIPSEANTFDAIAAFATLHHLYDPSLFFQEALRVLKPGGVLYTDHDIEAKFVKRFYYPLQIYRRFFDHKEGYLEVDSSLTDKDYHTCEYHGDTGIDGEQTVANLKTMGFRKVLVRYHWQGMIPGHAILQPFGLEEMPTPGLAPVFRILAVK